MSKSSVGIGVYGGDPGPVAGIHADVYLVHQDIAIAEAVRAANPNADIWGRFDDGRDNDQVETAQSTIDQLRLQVTELLAEPKKLRAEYDALEDRYTMALARLGARGTES